MFAPTFKASSATPGKVVGMKRDTRNLKKKKIRVM